MAIPKRQLEPIQDFFLMLKNIPLIRFNIQDMTQFKVLNEDLLPIAIAGYCNYQSLYEWLLNRNIPLSRANAKKLLNVLHLPQISDLTISLKCRALSLNDCYWIKIDDSDDWNKINLYENSFNEVLADVSLIGSSKTITIQGRIETPELTTQGTYAKCWVRQDDGIYLYKTRYDSFEPQAEVISSMIADILQINHVNYSLVKYQNRVCCKCKCIANLDYSIVPISDVFKAYEINTLYFSNLLKLFSVDNLEINSFYKMLLFDGLIGNIDRHSLNWGVGINSNTNEILGFHSLFDHNCAIDIRTPIYKHKNNDEYISSICGDKTILSLAKYAYGKLPNIEKYINNLDVWYNSKNAVKVFKKMYNRLNELEYLKKLLYAIVGGN